jgi:hypothetical protein
LGEKKVYQRRGEEEGKKEERIGNRAQKITWSFIVCFLQ